MQYEEQYKASTAQRKQTSVNEYGQLQEIIQMQYEAQCQNAFLPQDRQAQSSAMWPQSTANIHPTFCSGASKAQAKTDFNSYAQLQASTAQVKAEVNSYAQLQDGSLINFAFESAQELENFSSDEICVDQTCSNEGSGSGWGSGAAAQFAVLDIEPTLTNSHYVRSLDYGISFEDPQLNQLFQSSMTNRIERLWVGIFLSGAMACYFESSISYFYPTAYPFITSTGWILAYALIMSALGVGLTCIRTKLLTYGSSALPGVEGTSHGEYYRAKLLGEFAFYLTGLRHLSMLINKFYAEEPANVEDYTLIAFVLCTRPLVAAWAEMSPVGAIASTVPLWIAFLAQPQVSMVFQTRGVASACFCAWLAFVIYQNNREMFVYQVKLQHAHLITAELKQKQGKHDANTIKFNQDETRPDVSFSQVAQK